MIQVHSSIEFTVIATGNRSQNIQEKKTENNNIERDRSIYDKVNNQRRTTGKAHPNR